MSASRLDPRRALTEADEALPVTVFHPEGARIPWLFIRSWHGELAAYQRLAREVGADQPIYTVAPPSGSTREDYPASVDEWARWVCTRIAGLSGDYLIGGFSFGGLLGLHVTKEIGRGDIAFRHAALIDTSLPRKTHVSARSRSHRIVKALERILQLEPAQRRDYVRSKLEKRSAQRQRRKLDAAGASAGADDIITSTGLRMPLLKRAIWVAYLKYQPRLWDLPVSLYWTEESRAKTDDIALGWTRWLRGPLQVERVPGAHLSVMSAEHVRTLADKLSAVPLRRAGLERDVHVPLREAELSRA